MIKGFNPDRTEWPYEERPVEYRWKASHGRYLRPRDMTDEHLVNTLNWIERGGDSRRNMEGGDVYPNDEQLGQGHHYLRLEAIRRGLRWRSYIGQSLNDGDISRQAKRAKSYPPVKPDVRLSFESVALGQICVGSSFLWENEAFLKVTPMGEVLDCLLARFGTPDLRHFGRVGCMESLYSVVVKLRTGSCYLKRNNIQVFKAVDLHVTKKTPVSGIDSDTMGAWGPEYRC